MRLFVHRPSRSFGRPARIFAAGSLITAFLVGIAGAQLPTATLETVFPPGGMAGSEVEVKITGENLDEAKALQFSHPGITAQPKMLEPDEFHRQKRQVPGEFVMKIAKNVPPGIYEARVLSRYGISNPRAIVVGDRPEKIKEDRIDRPDRAMPLELGDVVNARADDDRIDYYRLSLEQGQSVLIDCWGQRIDSKIDATLVLLDPNGREIRRVRDVEHRDPVMHFTAPTSGDFILGVYDFVYNGGPEYAYRLQVSDGPFIDFIFPPVGTPGSNEQYTLYGRNLPGGKPADGMTMFGEPLEKITRRIKLPGDAQNVNRLPAGTFVQPHETLVRGGYAYQLQASQRRSNPVTIHYAAGPVVVEQEPNNDTPAEAQAVDAPCEYVGQFFPRRDRDWIEFQAKEGESFWLNVFSHRLGVRSDPYLIVQRVTVNDEGDEQVKVIKTADDPDNNNRNNPEMFDTHTLDPSTRLTADRDATYRVMVKDQYGSARSDPRIVYRLLIQKKQPDFMLLAYMRPHQDRRNELKPQSIVLRKGEAVAVRLHLVRRNGFRGDVNVKVEGLPSGVKCQGATLGGRVKKGWLVFEADENAKPWAGDITVVGTAEINGEKVQREARSGTLLWKVRQNEKAYSRMSQGLSLAVIDAETAPVSIQAGDGKVIETAYGGKYEIPVKVNKRAELKGDVKVSAVGLPKDIRDNDIKVKGGGDGKVPIELRSDRFPAGAYTFYLRGETKFRYERNQDAVKRAEQRKKEAEEIEQQLKEQEDKAREARDKANREAQDAENEFKEAKRKQENAEREEKEAAKRLEDAEKKLAQAKKEANANKDDQGKQRAAEDAQRELDERKKQHDEAVKQLEEANKALKEAQKRNETAQAARDEAEKAYETAKDKREKAEKLSQQADRNLKDVKNRNKPRDLDIKVVSSPVTLRVHEHPLEVDFKSPAGKVKQGEEMELPVSIKRLYGFDQKVDVELQLPGGVKGVSARRIAIDKGKNQGKLKLKASDNATAGKHQAKLEFRVRYGRVTREFTEPVTFEVEKVEQKAEK